MRCSDFQADSYRSGKECELCSSSSLSDTDSVPESESASESALESDSVLARMCGPGQNKLNRRLCGRLGVVPFDDDDGMFYATIGACKGLAHHSKQQNQKQKQSKGNRKRSGWLGGWLGGWMNARLNSLPTTYSFGPTPFHCCNYFAQRKKLTLLAS